MIISPGIPGISPELEATYLAEVFKDAERSPSIHSIWRFGSSVPNVSDLDLLYCYRKIPTPSEWKDTRTVWLQGLTSTALQHCPTVISEAALAQVDRVFCLPNIRPIWPAGFVPNTLPNGLHRSDIENLCMAEESVFYSLFVTKRRFAEGISIPQILSNAWKLEVFRKSFRLAQPVVDAECEEVIEIARRLRDDLSRGEQPSIRECEELSTRSDEAFQRQFVLLSDACESLLQPRYPHSIPAITKSNLRLEFSSDNSEPLGIWRRDVPLLGRTRTFFLLQLPRAFAAVLAAFNYNIPGLRLADNEQVRILKETDRLKREAETFASSFPRFTPYSQPFLDRLVPSNPARTPLIAIFDQLIWRFSDSNFAPPLRRLQHSEK